MTPTKQPPGLPARFTDPEGGPFGKVLSPSRKRETVDHVVEELGVSERRACHVVGQHRATQRRAPTPRAVETVITDSIVALAERFGRYGYRRVTALLRAGGG